MSVRMSVVAASECAGCSERLGGRALRLYCLLVFCIPLVVFPPCIDRTDPPERQDEKNKNKK